ncbi:TM2 domain-containing protein [Lucilia cuprina]|uniref:TM2 domain-containing protein n=1 Tax=Lucilia cuprina TaxID=7375 RepID=A0A0L0C410_LUCCU|nr:TM2 domain-containing protein CG11103 [Lucilia cuprina]KAI8126796.1 TM2 domain-containing protein [Lucilia cuprina]KNC26214.1 TM2 domain-containing protein [Lucilia cuprina]
MATLQYNLVIFVLILALINKSLAIQARSDREQQVSGAVASSRTADNTNVYHYWGPKVLCSMLPDDFIECNKPIDHKLNKTAKEEKGYGCLKFGGLNYEDVEHTKVQCTVFPDIDCHGPRTFQRDGVPCIRYSEHYFLTTLLYSLLLGFLGMDRFCLGQTGTAVGKLLTLGGVGVWWVVDIILLITNRLTPEDGSNWNPYV